MVGYLSPTPVGWVVSAGLPPYTGLGAVLPPCRTEVCAGPERTPRRCHQWQDEPDRDSAAALTLHRGAVLS
jgi:hypothetical protein